ncbi:PTS sugar transporter subunit IIB [Gilliamella sp. wkB112]|uniref:PTS sugar transporter subunit IIB n=1 Tax=Gilliamella sp. wkB112 TaxID=3120257 RepID=UPI00080DF9C8|nr:PTS sugar transporter subunit IIB [Gilliamella apicola]OCG02164.1 PTS sugar transporter subunit IIB [Gilliamella apicola]
MKKRIIFACTSGIATSTIATEKVKNYCAAHGIEVDNIQSDVATVQSQDGMADLVIVTSKVSYKLEKTPIINGVPLITTIGEEEVLAQIVNILKGN